VLHARSSIDARARITHERERAELISNHAAGRKLI
jgi:hypothetical protein